MLLAFRIIETQAENKGSSKRSLCHSSLSFWSALKIAKAKPHLQPSKGEEDSDVAGMHIPVDM